MPIHHAPLILRFTMEWIKNLLKYFLLIFLKSFFNFSTLVKSWRLNALCNNLKLNKSRLYSTWFEVMSNFFQAHYFIIKNFSFEEFIDILYQESMLLFRWKGLIVSVDKILEFLEVCFDRFVLNIVLVLLLWFLHFL